MRNTMAFVGDEVAFAESRKLLKERLHKAILQLVQWLERNDYKAYDPFDGLNTKFLPSFADHWFIRMGVQQGIRRFPLNLRPLLGIATSRSTKGMGYIAKGFIRLHQATGDTSWGAKAESSLQWLIDNQSSGYSGACWGNHFNYQSRGGFIPKGTPTVVWTSLIGHAFLDAYDHFGVAEYLSVADSACQHILRDLNRISAGDAFCLSYTPRSYLAVHNANTLGASLLARVSRHGGDPEYRSVAQTAIRYTIRHQRPDASWYYAESPKHHWVDNFHTAYVLDSLKYYVDNITDKDVEAVMMRGYEYWKRTFFLANGTPRYYDYKTHPLDIQCSSQAIDTLVFFSNRDPEALALASKVALWTLTYMQDQSGYFYYRRYSNWLVNRTPTLHWGQATMLCALAGLYSTL